MDQVEEVKQKTDIVTLVSEYVELKKAGRNFKGLCPFHSEKTPSFIVSPEIQIYKCFGCNAGGDVYRFLMELEKIDFPQALKILADRAGIKLIQNKTFQNFQEKEEYYQFNYLLSEFYHYLLTKHKLGGEARVYLKNRGITDEAIQTFKLGYSPESQTATHSFIAKRTSYSSLFLEKSGVFVKQGGRYIDRFRSRIIFPLFDHFGNIVGFSGRILKKSDLAKYINSPETLVYKKGKLLYGLEHAKFEIKQKGFAVVVEGEFDCISSYLAGVKNVVAIKGSALTSEQVNLLSRFCTKVTLALDTDRAGEEAITRGLEIAQKEGMEVRILVLEGFKDPDEAAQKDPSLWQEAVKIAVSVYDFLIDLSFRRNDPKTSEGKAKISREIIKVLTQVENEIVKAHLIKQVAQRLDVPEEAVAREVQKTPQYPQNYLKPEKTKKPDRHDLLEARLLQLSLRCDLDTVKNYKLSPYFRNPARRQIIEAFEKSLKTDSYNSASFIGTLPPELQESFASLVLAEIENEDQEWIRRELKSTMSQIEQLNLHEQMQVLAQKIKDLEKQNKFAELEGLEKKLAQISEKLAQASE